MLVAVAVHASFAFNGVVQIQFANRLELSLDCATCQKKRRTVVIFHTDGESYQVLINRSASSGEGRPAVVAERAAQPLPLLTPHPAPCHHCPLQLAQRLPRPVRHRAVQHPHGRSAGCNSGLRVGRKTREMPAGTTTFPLMCHPTRSSTSTTRFSGPAPTAAANSTSTTLIAATCTRDKINHQVSPVSGRAKA
jgi:hypothetical protein